MPPLYDDWFRGKSPADIIAMVATLTLATISEWSEQELKRVGWTNNPIIDILYSLTSAGVWVGKRDTSGKESGTYDAAIMNNLQMSGTPVIAADIGSSILWRSRINIVSATLVNGILADVPLVPASAGYYGVIDGIQVLMITQPHDTYLCLTFQDEDNTSLLGSGGGAIKQVIASGILNTTLQNIKLTQATYTDNKALEVDLATGADAGGDAADDYTVVLIVNYHYET